jgi:hypothetical protein
MPDSRQMLVHAGLHKTGTTWVQQNIFQTGARTYFRYSEDRALLRGTWAQPDYGDFDPVRAREHIIQGLEGAADLPVVLSDEILAGLPFHHRFGQGIIMERIAQTFPDAKILITVREQTSLIYSAYGHYLRGGHTSSLDRFLAVPDAKKAQVWRSVLDRSYYDYERLHALYARHFGAGNVKIVPMEWMIDKAEDFISEMEGFTGHSWPQPSPAAKDKRVNPAWTDLSRAYVRFANRFEDQDTRFARQQGRFSKSAIASKISRATPKSLDKRMKKDALDKIRRAIGTDYAASNRALAQRTGIDLNRYGYVMTNP